MQTLIGVKRILAVVGLNSDKSVQENERGRIQRAVIRLFTVASLHLWVVLGTLSILHESEKKLSIILRPFLLGLCAACGIIAYLYLIAKTGKITELADWLEVEVNSCMCCLKFQK